MADRDMEEISNGNWDIASSFDFHFRFLIQIFNLAWASKDIIIRYLTLEIIVEQCEHSNKFYNFKRLSIYLMLRISRNFYKKKNTN